MDTHLSRRELLKTAAVLSAPLSVGALLAQTGTAQGGVNPTVGVSTLGFHGHTNHELAKELKANGIHTIQLFLTQKDSNYWVYNGRADLSALGDAQCAEIANAYRDEGITIHSIGVYTNLIHPDENERKANLAYFGEMFRVGAAMNVKTFITEAGHYEPDTPDHGVPHYFREDVWYQMVETGRELVKLAESNDATILFEPFYRGFLASAKRTRLFVEALDSPRARVLLDPANLIELNDLEEMFTQLAPYIDCMHAKDRQLHVDRGVAAGQGDVDYKAFVRLAHQHAPHAPFILEYVGIEDYLHALQVLNEAIHAVHG